jgi:predicted DCC family thiol-disulfide oxidoreductase YuxK
MMMAPTTLNIIYDGRCEFCIRALHIVRALDLNGSCRFHDSHSPQTLAQFPALREVNLEEAMYLVVPDEPLREGFFAFRRLLWSNPLTWALIPIFYFPGASLLGPRLYAWVARNRYRFGCHSDICDLSSLPRS